MAIRHPFDIKGMGAAGVERERYEKEPKRSKEWMTLVDLAICSTSDAVDAIGTTFNFGYAKGYRAAMAEIKKGGAA